MYRTEGNGCITDKQEYRARKEEVQVKKEGSRAEEKAYGVGE